MSGLNERTKARSEELVETTAVTDSTQSPEPWRAIDGELLADDGLDGSRLPVPVFPLEQLTQPWRDWTGDAARLAGAPVDYVVQALLAAVAAVSSRVVVLPTPGWQEPLRLWMAAVGEPASGKSPALETVQRLLWTLEDTSGLATRVPPRRILLPEGRFERLACALREDRRGKVLWRDDAVACLAPPAGARSVRRLEPYPVSIVGTVPPVGVELALRQDPDSAARFLYAWPQPQAFRTLPGLDLPSSTLLQPFTRLLRVLDLLELPHGLLLDEPAGLAFEAFRARLHEERCQAGGIEAAWLGKGGRAVARLAGVFAVMSWAASDAESMPHRVDLDAMERAVSLWWDYYRPHAVALFGQRGPSEESQARRVARWLRAQGRAIVSREDIRRSALREAVDARAADDVIACLVEAGALRLRPRVLTHRAGRPALRWEVNPLLMQREESKGNLTLRCARSARLEGAVPNERLMPTLRDAALHAAPQGEEAPRANRGNRDNRQTH